MQHDTSTPHRYRSGTPFLIWFGLLITITIVTLLATYFYKSLAEVTGLLGALRLVSLVEENGLGAWWSSMLLLIAGMHAGDGYLRTPTRNQDAGRPWLSLAIICVLLSLDEAGSLHERVMLLSESWGMSSWALLVPPALILGSLFAYCFFGLAKYKASRGAAFGIAIAFALFALVALQERLEHTVAWSSAAVRSLRILIEEGTEMIAILLLVFISSHNSGGIFSRVADRKPVFAMADRRFWIVAIIALVVTPLIAWLNASFTDQDRGHPADWMGAALFLLAAAVATQEAFLAGRFSTRAFLVGTSCILASAGCMAARMTYGVEFFPFEFSKAGAGLSVRMVFLALISGVLAISALAWSKRKASCLTALCLSALICLAAANQNSLFIIYAATVATSALCYFAVALGAGRDGDQIREAG